MAKGSVRVAGEFFRFSKDFFCASNDFLHASNDFLRATSLEVSEFFRAGDPFRILDELSDLRGGLELPKGLLLGAAKATLSSPKGLPAPGGGDVSPPKGLLLSLDGPNELSKGLSDGLFAFSPNGFVAAILTSKRPASTA